MEGLKYAGENGDAESSFSGNCQPTGIERWWLGKIWIVPQPRTVKVLPLCPSMLLASLLINAGIISCQGC